MSDVELHRRILELEEQVSDLSKLKRELEAKVEELTPRKVFTATLITDQPLYWTEIQSKD
jgi:hypothetical protein